MWNIPTHKKTTKVVAYTNQHIQIQLYTHTNIHYFALTYRQNIHTHTFYKYYTLIKRVVTATQNKTDNNTRHFRIQPKKKTKQKNQPTTQTLYISTHTHSH